MRRAAAEERGRGGGREGTATGTGTAAAATAPRGKGNEGRGGGDGREEPAGVEERIANHVQHGGGVVMVMEAGGCWHWDGEGFPLFAPD